MVLLGIVLFGGGLRFAYLTRPCLWGDECATYSRVCGDYRQMLGILQTDGFAPLHYELYWVMKQFIPLTAWQMRSVPAAGGTLMILAMYFLTRQLAGRRTALLAAAFTACSAYMLVYSRDAKMYMHFWMFLTLHVACLLWWFRCRRRVAWLAWIASGLAAMGLHSVGMIVLPVEVLLLLTSRRLHWRTTILFLLGLLLIGAGPGGYYLGFNHWIERSGGVTPGVGETEQGNPDWEASGIGWIEEHTRNKTGPELVFDSATAYLYSWSRAEDYPGPTGRIDINPKVLLASTVAISVMLSLLALGVLPWPQRWRGGDADLKIANRRSQIADSPDPWWRQALWLSAWLIVPTYGFFYCRSVQKFVSPDDWVRSVGSLFSDRWIWRVGAAILVIAVLSLLWRRLPVLLASLLPLLAAVTLSAALFSQSSDWFDQRLTLLDWLDQCLALLTHPYTLRGAVLIGPPLLWYFSGQTIGQRMLKLIQLALVVAILYAVCLGAFKLWSHLYEEAERNNPRVIWKSVWMPRYLGVIWPAVGIAVAMLLRRLPTRPFRWAAIAVVLGINLTQGIARVWLSPEPPIDLVARDIADAQDPKATTRTYCPPIGGGLGAPPGTATIHGWVGKFYLCVDMSRQLTPLEFRRQSLSNFFDIRPYNGPYSVAEARNQSRIKTVVVWERFTFGQLDTKDRLLPLMGSQWKLESEQVYPTWNFWKWQRLHAYRRRCYVRQEVSAPSAKSPATSPSAR